MHENREISSAPSVIDEGRSVKAYSRTTDMYVLEKSDCAVVPVNRPNKGRQLPAEVGMTKFDAKTLGDFLKESPLPWPTIFEPGGLEGRLGTEFGIIVLPTMILVDAEGKVISRSVRNAADLDIQLDKALANKANGVAAARAPN